MKEWSMMVKESYLRGENKRGGEKMKRRISMFVLISMLILSSASLAFADNIEEGIIIIPGTPIPLEDMVDDMEHEIVPFATRYPYRNDPINGNTELPFSTIYTRNYFRVAFTNTGNNDVTIWITSPSDPKQKYKLEIPAYEYNDVYFGNVRANDYLLDITGDRGGQCKGELTVRVSDTAFN